MKSKFLMLLLAGGISLASCSSSRETTTDADAVATDSMGTSGIDTAGTGTTDTTGIGTSDTTGTGTGSGTGGTTTPPGG